MAETGHARNVEHFGTMIVFVDGWGAAYNPSNAAIELAALQAKLAAALNAIDAVTTAVAPWKVNVNFRENKFAGISQLVTRVVNSFAASGAEDNAIEDAKGYQRKINGSRATALPEDDPETPEDESQGNSVSQRSYTQLVEHFDNLIELLDNDANYAPNETELQITQLQARSAELKDANEAVVATRVPVSNARLARNAVLYDDKEGLVELAGLVKNTPNHSSAAILPNTARSAASNFVK